VDGAVVESQAAAGQWKCVQPVTAVGWRNWEQPSFVRGVAHNAGHRLSLWYYYYYYYYYYFFIFSTVLLCL